jgi:hypothetical protein
VWRLLALLVASQVANTAGFLYEWGNQGTWR